MSLENSVLNPIIKDTEKDSDSALLLAYGGAKDSNTKDLGFKLKPDTGQEICRSILGHEIEGYFSFWLSILAVIYLLVAGNEQFLIISSWFCFASFQFKYCSSVFQLHRKSCTDH